MNKSRENGTNHKIEQVGKGLREMMSALFKNKMIMEGEGYFFLSVEDVKEFIRSLPFFLVLDETQIKMLIKLAGEKF